MVDFIAKSAIIAQANYNIHVIRVHVSTESMTHM